MLWMLAFWIPAPRHNRYAAAAGHSRDALFSRRAISLA